MTTLQYLNQFAFKENIHLSNLRAIACEKKLEHIQVSPMQGATLTFLTRLIHAEHALELGTLMGYSSLAIALGLRETGQLITCDHDSRYLDIAKTYWSQAGVASRIETVTMDAMEYIEQYCQLGPWCHSRESGGSYLSQRDSRFRGNDSGVRGNDSGEKLFDIIFLDADKKRYIEYYHALKPLLQPSGLLIIDNTLWHGKVTQSPPYEDPRTQVIHELNTIIANDQTVNHLLLPIGDGLTVVQRTQ